MLRQWSVPTTLHPMWKRVYRGKTAQGSTSRIDIHQLPAGIYYLLLGSGKQATQVVAWYKG